MSRLSDWIGDWGSILNRGSRPPPPPPPRRHEISSVESAAMEESYEAHSSPPPPPPPLPPPPPPQPHPAIAPLVNPCQSIQPLTEPTKPAEIDVSRQYLIGDEVPLWDGAGCALDKEEEEEEEEVERGEINVQLDEKPQIEDLIYSKVLSMWL